MTNATPPFTTGMVVTFTGYSDADMAEDDMIFHVGDMVRIERVNPDGGMVAMPVEGDGPGDTVFPEEVRVTEETASETAEEEAAPAPETKAKTKAKAKKAKAKVADEPASEEAAPAAATTGVQAYTHSAEVAAMLSEHDALTAAKMLIEHVEETYISLGEVLATIYREGIHKSVGYDGKRGFADYVHAELGIQYRKAMYLISIHEKMQALGVDASRLREIGWSKAKELVLYATAETFDELVDYAKDNTRDDLVAYMKQNTVSDGTEGTEGGTITKTRLTFSLFGDQGETVVRAIDAAKALLGSDDPNQALEYVCHEWSQMTESVEVPLADAIAHLNAKYGVSVAVPGAVEEAQASETETVAA